MKTHLGSPKYVKVSAVDMTLMQPCRDKQFSAELFAPWATLSGQLLVGSACAGGLFTMEQQELVSDILTQAETATSQSGNWEEGSLHETHNLVAPCAYSVALKASHIPREV